MVRTPSITWITPLLASMSTVFTLAPLIVTVFCKKEEAIREVALTLTYVGQPRMCRVMQNQTAKMQIKRQ
jgi:hypothetical protein